MNVRAALSIAVTGVAALALAGCAIFTPVATKYEYDPGDGVSAELGNGDVDLEGIVVITEDGELGNLLLTAVNTTDSDIELDVQYASNGTPTTLTVTLPAQSSTPVGWGEAGQFPLEGMAAPAGSLVDIYFQYGAEPGAELQVPVLDAGFVEYTELVPTPVPTVTLVPTETPTPAAEG